MTQYIVLKNNIDIDRLSKAILSNWWDFGPKTEKYNYITEHYGVGGAVMVLWYLAKRADI